MTNNSNKSDFFQLRDNIIEALYKHLNNEQRKAVLSISGPLLILAGAGSGKTSVLVNRIANILSFGPSYKTTDINFEPRLEDLEAMKLDLESISSGAKKEVSPYVAELMTSKRAYPSQILAITFTNKAAGEMRERVKKIIGDEAENMWVSTFHSSCVRILRREIESLGYNKNFGIYDGYDQKVLIKQCMEELNISDKDISEREIISKIGEQKDNLISAEQFKKENERNYRLNKIADVYLLYSRKCKTNNSLDFDDLIFKTVELFKNNSEVLEFYQRKFKYILVDEYQDTNKAQYELIRLLATSHKNICVVGDDDQCLVEGTKVYTPKGTTNVEVMREWDKVLGGNGHGEIAGGSIDKIMKRKYNGPVVNIKTTSGKAITLTPNHIVFGRAIESDEHYYVYIAHSLEAGFNLGYVSGTRLNEVRANKLWIVKCFKDLKFAQYYTNSMSETYFSEESDDRAVEQMMKDFYLFEEHPHKYLNCDLIKLNFFGGERDTRTGVFKHDLTMTTPLGTPPLSEGFASYSQAESYGKMMLQRNSDAVLVRTARLTPHADYSLIPAGSLRKYMTIPVEVDGDIVPEIIEEITYSPYNGTVYDLSVPHLRQFISNGILVHNCIYAWRGADIRNILDFEKDYPNTSIIKLEQNYRSVGNILRAANDVIQNNTERKDKVLRTDSSEGEKIKIYRAYSDNDEAGFVAREINKIKREEYIGYSSFAILYRTNAQSRIFESTFMKLNIPYRIVGGQKFYDRKEIKDIMAYLKVINNPADDLSLLRIINVPKRSIGDATVLKLQEWADYNNVPLTEQIQKPTEVDGLSARAAGSVKKFSELMDQFVEESRTLPVSELIKSVLDNTGYMTELRLSKEIEDRSRLENLEELVSAAVEFEETSEDKSLSAFLEGVALVSDIDTLEAGAEAVVLMTVHSAKGLEFPVVFMAGMENGIFPGTQSINDPKEMEESRRLCYVGITRAKELLYMTSAESRNVFGRYVNYPESDFIGEISSELKDILSEKKSSSTSSYNSSWSAGTTREEGKNSYSKYNFAYDEWLKSATPVKKEATQKPTGQGNVLPLEECILGTKVRHTKFGEGTIVTVSKESSGTKLTVAFDNMGIKILMYDLAKLERP